MRKKGDASVCGLYSREGLGGGRWPVGWEKEDEGPGDGGGMREKCRMKEPPVGLSWSVQVMETV